MLLGIEGHSNAHFFTKLPIHLQIDYLYSVELIMIQKSKCKSLKTVANFDFKDRKWRIMLMVINDYIFYDRNNKSLSRSKSFDGVPAWFIIL